MVQDIALGSVIYVAVKPIFKIYIIIGCGFFLGKRNILTVETARNISDVVLSVILPCLVFDKIVTNIKNSDIKQIGIIVFIATVLYLMGGLGSVLLFYVTKTPRYWRGGLICAGLLPNISDLPIAYIQTLASGLVFTSDDGDKGIAYIIIYTAVQVCAQFNLGSFKLIGGDFEVEKKMKLQDAEKSIESSGSSNDQNAGKFNEDYRLDDADISSLNSGTSADTNATSHLHAILPLRRETLTNQQSHLSRTSTNIALRRDRSQTIDNVIEEYSQVNDLKDSTVTPGKFTELAVEPTQTEEQKPKGKLAKALLNNPLVSGMFFFVDNLKRPISISLIFSITVAMIPWVQNLFVTTSQAHIPNAPDEQPPLSFIMDFASYLAGACVPLGLLLLGATLSRLKIGSMPPGFWQAPLGLTLWRLVILPIIGVALVSKLKRDGWFDGNDMLMFVSCLVWGLPNATSLIYLTAFYTPLDGEHHSQMDYLALSYIMQYCILFVSLPFLTTYIVKVSLST